MLALVLLFDNFCIYWLFVLFLNFSFFSRIGYWIINQYFVYKCDQGKQKESKARKKGERERERKEAR